LDSDDFDLVKLSDKFTLINIRAVLALNILIIWRGWRLGTKFASDGNGYGVVQKEWNNAILICSRALIGSSWPRFSEWLPGRSSANATLIPNESFAWRPDRRYRDRSEPFD
jgi:hypothetical protein